MSNPNPKVNTPTPTPESNSTEPNKLVIRLPRVNKTMVKVATTSFTAGAAIATLVLKIAGHNEKQAYMDLVDEDMPDQDLTVIATPKDTTD